MALHVKNAETERLARKLAAVRGVGLTEAVTIALRNELEREAPSDADTEHSDFVKRALDFSRRIRAEGRPDLGLPADKEFIDSLYE